MIYVYHVPSYYILYSNIIILQVCDEGLCSRSKPWMLKTIFKEFRTFWSGFYSLLFWRMKDVMENSLTKGNFMVLYFQNQLYWLWCSYFPLNLSLSLSHLLSSTPSNDSTADAKQWNSQLKNIKWTRKKKPSTDFYFLGQFCIMLMVVSSWLCNVWKGVSLYMTEIYSHDLC